MGNTCHYQHDYGGVRIPGKHVFKLTINVMNSTTSHFRHLVQKQEQCSSTVHLHLRSKLVFHYC